MGGILTYVFSLAGCGASLGANPDDPPAFPDADYEIGTDGGPPADVMNAEPDTEPECVPDSCNPGVIDPDRSYEDQGVCLSFNEVHTEEGLVSSVPHNGVSVVDYNQDGLPDIFLLNNGSPNQLFQNTGNGFRNVTLQTGLNRGGNSQDAAWADYDSDGDLDLFLAGSDGSELYKNEDGFFNLLEGTLGIHNQEAGKKAAWLGSGFLLGTENGTRFYRYEGNDEFVEASTEIGLDDPGDASAIAVADYDGDGHDDVYAANIAGQNRLFRNLGNGTYESVETETGTEGSGSSTDAKWVSVNGEALPSLYVTDFYVGNQLLINQQNGTFIEEAGPLGIRDPGQTTVSAWGDFINEGAPALFLGRWDQQNLVYVPVINDDGEITGYRETALPLGMATEARTIGAVWFDYDNDELLDLLVVTADGGIELHRNKTREVRLCPEEK